MSVYQLHLFPGIFPYSFVSSGPKSCFHEAPLTSIQTKNFIGYIISMWFRCFATDTDKSKILLKLQ